MLTRILLSEEFDPDPCCEKNSDSNFKVCLVSKKKDSDSSDQYENLLKQKPSKKNTK